MKITEIKNDLPKTKPIKEIMSVFIPNINSNLPNRNGAIYAIIGSPGSGKTNLLFSTLFKNRNYYRSKFDNIFLITPESSFLSLSKHPFQEHDKVYHDLNVNILEAAELTPPKAIAIPLVLLVTRSCLDRFSMPADSIGAPVKLSLLA